MKNMFVGNKQEKGGWLLETKGSTAACCRRFVITLTRNAAVYFLVFKDRNLVDDGVLRHSAAFYCNLRQVLRLEDFLSDLLNRYLSSKQSGIAIFFQSIQSCTIFIRRKKIGNVTRAGTSSRKSLPRKIILFFLLKQDNKKKLHLKDLNITNFFFIIILIISTR